MARVFLSYSRKDLAVAQQIAAALERLGHELWWDRQLHAGARFIREIEAALAKADAVIVLWSTHSVTSAWVQDEAAEGRDSGRLVPVALDGSTPPLGFRQYHAIQYRGARDNDALAAIEQAIAALGGGAIAQPAAAPATEPRPNRRWAIAGLLALVLAAAAAWLLLPKRETRAPELVVADFRALEGDVPEDSPAALAEEMLAALGTDPRFAARRSSASAVQSGDYVAGGSLRTSGDRLRVTVNLSERRSGVQLWTASFERPLSQSHLAPRQIGIAASMVIRCGLTGPDQHRARLANEALAAYLNYCAEFWAETGGREMSARRGLDFARQSVAIEPKFARGWSAIGRMASWAIRQSPDSAAPALRREAHAAARRALKIDPSNSQAYEVLASLEPRNSLARERLYAKAVAVRPGDCGCEHVGYGGFLSGVGRSAEALDQFRRARDIVPASVSVNSSLAEALYAAGRNEEADKLVVATLEVWPTDRQMQETVLRAAFWTGQKDRAQRSLADPATHFAAAERKAYSAALGAITGSPAMRAESIARLVELSRDPGSRRPLLITALAALGADPQAMALAGDLFGADGSPGQFVLFEPALAQTRTRPEFSALAQRIGLVRFWRESARPPDFCAIGTPPPVCRVLR